MPERETKSGTRLYGVPPDNEMREARDALRRETREASERYAREAFNSDAPRLARRVWGTSIHDSEVAADLAVLRDDIENIARARALKQRKGRPLDVQGLLNVIDALAACEPPIPLKIWRGSPAHKKIIEILEVPDSASTGDSAAFSILRKLGHLAKRRGLRT